MIPCPACECVQEPSCRRCAKPFPAATLKAALPDAPIVPTIKTLAEIEREAIIVALALYSPQETAKLLGVGKTTIYRKMREYGLKLQWSAA